MLKEIVIKNFLLVEHLHLYPQSGLTTITGETGAGKSIIVDAIALALGTRAENAVVRHGAHHCDISLIFSPTPALIQWLTQQALLDGEDCIVRRVIDKNGRSRISVNGIPCAQSSVRELAGLVFTIHGQHQSQALLKQQTQQQQLDRYAHHDHWLKEMNEYYHAWQHIQKKVDNLRQQATQGEEQLTWLRYQHTEINELNLQAGEWQRLSQEHQRLHHSKELMAQIHNTLTLISDDPQHSAELLLDNARQALQHISIDDDRIKNIKELLNNTMIHLQETRGELQHYLNDVDVNPQRLAEVEQRLGQIYDIARKHHVDPDDLIPLENTLQQKIDDLEHAEQRIQDLLQQQKEITRRYQHVADQLSKSRQQAAQALSELVTKYMPQLNMPGGQFTVRLTPQAEGLSLYGQESVSFWVRTNPKQAAQPLTKIISGGELSRINLALQVITAQQDDTPTLLFDEVDTGISGQTAAVVGTLLKQLGGKTQVFCITHLPQIAAQGDHHWRVHKQSNSQQTHTTILCLDGDARITEIARLLSGHDISEQSVLQAKELMEM